MAIDQDKALEIAESLLWSHEADGKRIVAQHPSPELVAQRFRAYAAECVRRERVRCAGIIRKHIKAGKVDRVDWLCDQIAAQVEREG